MESARFPGKYAYRIRDEDEPKEANHSTTVFHTRLVSYTV